MEYFVIQIKKTFCYSFSIFKVNGLTVYHVIMEYFSQGFTGMANFAFLAVTGVTNFMKVQLVLFSSCFPSKFLTRSNCIFPCSLQNLSRITSYFHNTYTEWRTYGCFTLVHNVDGTLSFPRLLLRSQLSFPWLVFGANRQRSTAMSISLFL